MKKSSEPATRNADHEQVLAGLKSADWEQRLEAARVQRAKALKAKANSTVEKPLPLAAYAGAKKTGHSPDTRIAKEEAPRDMPDRAITSEKRRSVWIAPVALILISFGVAAWLLATGPAPIADTQPETAVVQATAQGNQTEPAEDTRLSFGLPEGNAIASQGDYVTAEIAPEPEIEPAEQPTAPLTPTEKLQDLARILPAETRIHVGADMDIAYSGSDLQLLRSPFATDGNLVRYYHAADREIALQSARIIDAEAVDFTNYAPKPGQGMIEIWFGG